MSKIDIQNYEAFYLDYLEGNLVMEDVAQLLLFLEGNPELKSELEQTGLVELPIDDELVLNKRNLIRNIDEENVEEFIIADLESQLKPEDESELREFLIRSPETKTLANRYKKTILRPDEIVFEDKESLKRKSLRMLQLVPVLRVAAAILVFVLLSLPISDDFDPKVADIDIHEILKGGPMTSDHRSEIAALTDGSNGYLTKSNDPDSTINPVVHTVKKPVIFVSSVKPLHPPDPVLVILSLRSIDISVPIIDGYSAPVDSLERSEILIANETVTDSSENDLSSGSITLGQWANKEIRKAMLKEKTPRTERINGNEVITALVNQIDKVTRSDITYNREQSETVSSFSISIGKFEFSRSKRRSL